MLGLMATPTFLKRSMGYMIGIHKRPAKFLLDQSKRSADVKPASLAEVLLPAVEAWGLDNSLCFIFVPHPLGPMTAKLSAAKFIFANSAEGDYAKSFAKAMFFSDMFFPLYQTLRLVQPRQNSAGVLALDSRCSEKVPAEGVAPTPSREAPGPLSWLPSWVPFVH